MNEPDPNNENENKTEPNPDETQITEVSFEPAVSPVAAAFIGLFGSFFLYQIVGGTLTLLILGLNIDEAPVDGVRIMTSAGQILFILIPALILAKWVYNDIGTIIRFKKADWKGLSLFLAGIIILTPLLQSFIAIQNYFFFKPADNYECINSIKIALDQMNEMVEKTYANLLSANSVLEGIFVVAVVAIVPAVSEEFMFRGFVQKSFEFKLKPIWAIAITSVFFGLYHFNPYGIVALISLGIYFGFAAYLSNSILIPIVLHFFNNFTAVMLYFVFKDDELIKSVSDKDIDLVSALTFFITLLLMFSLIVALISKHYQNKKRREYAILPKM